MRASGYLRADDDYYVEPRWAVDALLNAETFSGLSWDPACGGGNIPKALRQRGLACMGSDLIDRGYEDGIVPLDFFTTERRDHHQIVNIISNPPFEVIETFIRHALTMTTGKVAVLARLALLEGIKRREMFRGVPFARMWASSRRMSMPPGGRDITAKGGAIAYAWFVFEHGHTGPATIGWLDV